MTAAAAVATTADDAARGALARRRSSLRTIAFAIARAIGLFALARRLYRHRQCILGYHAFAFEDEHLFRPQLYMHPDTFARRLDLLRRLGYRVIPLAEAARRLRDGGCTLREVALTIDDGFSSVHRFAAPALRARGLPATLYLTTYYVDKPFPVFELALQYVVWKSKLPRADLGLDRFGVDVGDPVPLSGAGSEAAMLRILDLAQRALDDPSQQALVAHVAERVGVSLEAALAHRRFHLVTGPMARELREADIMLELHTHRHRLPQSRALLEREIVDNREALARLGAPRAQHLCYPSGEWREDAFGVLAELDVATAATTIAGLNDRRTPPYALRRFLDADDIPDVEFEAEISGFKQLLRDCRAALPI